MSLKSTAFVVPLYLRNEAYCSRWVFFNSLLEVMTGHVEELMAGPGTRQGVLYHMRCGRDGDHARFAVNPSTSLNTSK